MGPQTLTNRLEVLERKVESLERLPEQMHALELQILQFREEMRVEFSTIRAGDEETRTYMRVLHEEVLSRIALLGEHRDGRPRSRQPVHSKRHPTKG